MKASITIRDVARTAEVSVGTASRVINGKSTVGAEVRDRVLKAIETLGYHPDAIAQSMRRGSTHVIGCVIRDINIPSLAAFVHAAHNVLDRAGFSLLVSNSDGEPSKEYGFLCRRALPCMTTMMCEPPEKTGRLPPPTGASLKCLISGVTCSMPTTSTAMVCAPLKEIPP